MKIYTKTGDKGTSGLYNGERRLKSDPVFSALGTVDELNGAIAVGSEHCQDKEVKLWLEEVSSRLFDVGSAIATPLTSPSSSQSKLNHTLFSDSNVTWLECKIDDMDKELPPLKNFILPMGGGLASSQFHFARTIARKAEREVWPLIQDQQVDESVGRYLNRLSDFLFTVARWVAKLEGREETIYKKVRDVPPREGM
jgi:cob(I)alamin adenosyltransferase